MELTPDEKLFLVNLLCSLSIKPSDKDSLKTVSVVHSLLGKLSGEALS